MEDEFRNFASHVFVKQFHLCSVVGTISLVRWNTESTSSVWMSLHSSISPVRSEHSRRTHSIINNFSLVVDARPRYKKHPCPSCCAVAQHRMDRGACVYCRLLSVLLMQIIKFGGKLVVNPRCSSIERHNFKRNKAIFCVLLLNRLHRGDRSRKAHKWLYFPL